MLRYQSKGPGRAEAFGMAVVSGALMANLRADFIGIVLSPDDAYRGNRMRRFLDARPCCVQLIKTRLRHKKSLSHEPEVSRDLCLGRPTQEFPPDRRQTLHHSGLDFQPHRSA
ncbi:hypothetical protein D9M69_505230 [compost metagenome]